MNAKPLASLALAVAALAPLARADRYLVGYRTVYVVKAVDPHEEDRYRMDLAYGQAYDAVLAKEDADLRLVDDLALRHPSDAPLLDRLRARIHDDAEGDIETAALDREARLAALDREARLAQWYDADPHVYEVLTELHPVYARERPVSVVEVRLTKNHRSDQYVLVEPYRAHRDVAPPVGWAYGRRLSKEEVRRAFVAEPPRKGDSWRFPASGGWATSASREHDPVKGPAPRPDGTNGVGTIEPGPRNGHKDRKGDPPKPESHDPATDVGGRRNEHEVRPPKPETRSPATKHDRRDDPFGGKGRDRRQEPAKAKADPPKDDKGKAKDDRRKKGG